MDGGRIAFGDHGPPPEMDGNGDVAEIRAAGAEGVAAVGTGIFLRLLKMQAVFLVGVADIFWEKQ